MDLLGLESSSKFVVVHCLQTGCIKIMQCKKAELYSRGDNAEAKSIKADLSDEGVQNTERSNMNQLSQVASKLFVAVFLTGIITRDMQPSQDLFGFCSCQLGWNLSQ